MQLLLLYAINCSKWLRARKGFTLSK